MSDIDRRPFQAQVGGFRGGQWEWTADIYIGNAISICG